MSWSVTRTWSRCSTRFRADRWPWRTCVRMFLLRPASGQRRCGSSPRGGLWPGLTTEAGTRTGRAARSTTSPTVAAEQSRRYPASRRGLRCSTVRTRSVRLVIIPETDSPCPLLSVGGPDVTGRPRACAAAGPGIRAGSASPSLRAPHLLEQLLAATSLPRLRTSISTMPHSVGVRWTSVPFLVTSSPPDRL